jgi:choline-sulfatase
MEDTVVIFCTDHGDMIGDLNRNHKSLWHDPSCRTPLTVSWPGIVEEGRTRDFMVESVDLPCTVLEIAGCDPIRWLPQTPGRSFWKSLAGGDEPRKWAYSECGIGEKAWRMVCGRRWKYVWHAAEGEMLFHRENDPHDSVNLADLPAQGDVLDLMKGRLIESMTRCVAPNSVPLFTTGEY